MKQSLLAFFLVAITVISAQAQDTTQQQYLGKYKFPAGSVVEEVNVVFENGALMMNSTAGTSSLQLVKGDTFTIVSFNGTAVFKRNESGKVNGVHIDASGYVLDGVKDESKINILELVAITTGREIGEMLLAQYIASKETIDYSPLIRIEGGNFRTHRSLK